MGPTPNLRTTTAAAEAAPATPVKPAAAAPVPVTDATLPTLQSLFKMAYATYYTAQASHWHVTGPDFQKYHDFFGAEYEYWAGKIDIIAEHIRTHKATLPCCLVELAKGTPSNAETGDARSLIKRYLQYLNVVLSLVTKLNTAAEAADAAADIDLAGELAREVKKAIWKAESMLS